MALPHNGDILCKIKAECMVAIFCFTKYLYILLETLTSNCTFELLARCSPSTLEP